MAIKPVLRMGDPRLLEASQPVKRFDTAELHELIGDMQDTMRALDGAGLCRPPDWRCPPGGGFGLERNPRYPDADAVPFTVLVNPVLTPLGREMEEGWEGCLSVPGMRGLVPRFRRIEYQGFDQAGVPVHCSVNGFHARVVQHECDHLDGILYPMPHS